MGSLKSGKEREEEGPYSGGRSDDPESYSDHKGCSESQRDLLDTPQRRVWSHSSVCRSPTKMGHPLHSLAQSPSTGVQTQPVTFTTLT